jgi:hypothetical protein
MQTGESWWCYRGLGDIKSVERQKRKVRFRRCERWNDKPLGLNTPRILVRVLIGTIAGSDSQRGCKYLISGSPRMSITGCWYLKLGHPCTILSLLRA